MKFNKISIFIALVTLLFANSISAESSNRFARENNNYSSLRIASASVAISQVLSAMGQELVARPTTRYPLPKEYQNLPEIGNSHAPDIEKILVTKTQLLIGDQLFKSSLEKTIAGHDIELFLVDTSSYDKFTQSIAALGKKIGKEKEATKIIKTINSPIKKYKGKKTNKTIAILFGASESNQLATENSYVGSLVKVLGGKNIVNSIAQKDKNILSKAENGYVNFNVEQILANQPDIIIRFGHGNVDAATKSFEKLFNENPAFKNLKATKNKKVYDLDSAIFGVSANLRISEALDQLGKIIYEK